MFVSIALQQSTIGKKRGERKYEKFIVYFFSCDL